METTRKKYKPICDISKNQKTGRQYIKNNTYLSVRGYNMTEDKNIPLKSSSNLIQEKLSIFSHLSYLLSSDLIQENTSHTSSSNTGQGNFLLSSSSPSSHLSSSNLIGGSIKDKGSMTLSNLSQTNKGYIPSNNLLQKKKYNSLSSNSSQYKGYTMNPTILPQQNGFNTNPNNLPQQKEYNSNNLPKKKGYNMKQPNLSQSGRSMVEMLGSLAIIGVLSVGGIMGYSYGMDKWRANETVNDINLRRIILTQQASQNNILSLNEFSEKSTIGYAFLPPQEFDDSVALTINGLPKRVCKMTIEALFDQTVQIDINRSAIDKESDCGEDNNITFYFPIDTLGDDERGQNGCALSTPIYNTDTDTCEACPEKTPIFDTISQTCVECVAHSDCGDTASNYCLNSTCGICSDEKPLWNDEYQICAQCLTDDDCKNQGDKFYCFSDNSSSTSPNYSICKSMTYSVSYAGTDLTRVFLSTDPDWWDAKKACNLLNMRLPLVTDFFPDWNGEKGPINLTPASEYKSLFWPNGQGAYAMDINEIAYMVSFFMHISQNLEKNYTHSSHQILCKP